MAEVDRPVMVVTTVAIRMMAIVRPIHTKCWVQFEWEKVVVFLDKER